MRYDVNQLIEHALGSDWRAAELAEDLLDTLDSSYESDLPWLAEMVASDPDLQRAQIALMAIATIAGWESDVAKQAKRELFQRYGPFARWLLTLDDPRTFKFIKGAKSFRILKPE